MPVRRGPGDELPLVIGSFNSGSGARLRREPASDFAVRLRNGRAAPPIGSGDMAKHNEQQKLREENRQLRDALRQCRELLERTEKVLQRANRSGGPAEDSSPFG